MYNIEKLALLIKEAKHTVFFGGAGVSTASGIPDFRSANGLYSGKHKYSPETMLSHTFFMQHTDLFFQFYRSSMIYPNAKPNAAHKALALLEQNNKLAAIITQNIDGLHQAAGAKNVLELHGSVHRNYCMECGAYYDLNYVLKTDGIPHCSKCGGIVKPDVVLYEEALDEGVIYQSIDHIRKADLLIIGGTSLVVYPAASFVDECRGKIVLINKDATYRDNIADLVIHESIDYVLDEAVRIGLKLQD
ncbi:MAG: NAD-dependent protein deacylase [Eubacteriales bacterium]|nr:NAD-dependent protein deacylase [Eubacteriales bacterium]